LARRNSCPNTDADFLIEPLIAPLYLRLPITRQPLTPGYADQIVDRAIATTHTGAD
jgi:hypothetical protein